MTATHFGVALLFLLAVGIYSVLRDGARRRVAQECAFVPSARQLRQWRRERKGARS